MKKEKISNDYLDNLDMHYDRRKKELYDCLLKKI
jgi:hypothetical protein